MFHSRSSHGPVDLAFSDRFGGVRVVGPGAVPDAGQDDLRRVLGAFAPGDRYADLRQVHGSTVVTAAPGTHPEADGVVTAEAGITLVIRVADCVPVLLADSAAGVIGAAHAGRLGTASGVVPATLARMRDLGAHDVTAWIGPHICGRCYEVPEQMQAEIGAVVPAAVATTSWGTPALDLGVGVRAQLEADGVTVLDASACTRETPELWSHRRDGAEAGRLVALIRRAP